MINSLEQDSSSFEQMMLAGIFSANHSGLHASTYTIDLLDEILKDQRRCESVIGIDGIGGEVLKHHLHSRVIQLEGFNRCSRY